MSDIMFMDLKRQEKLLEEDVLTALRSVCQETAFSGGPYAARFEQEFAQWLKVPSFISCSNGTDALVLALKSMGIGPGDEVIVPANTYVATAWSAMWLGATPVFADCTPDTWEIDPEDVERKITSRTRAIIGVHLYGEMFDVDRLKAIAEKHGLFLLEDCAQAQGSTWNGQAAGSLTDGGCFSFYPSKNLGAYGEAGGLILKDTEHERKARIIRNQGMEATYHHTMLGSNKRMDGMQAAVLSVKLPHLASWNQRRFEITRRYHQELADTPLTFQKNQAACSPAYYLAVCCVKDREHFMNFMADNGIRCGIHYPIPCHLQPAMAIYGGKPGDHPNAEYETSHCVSLPLFPELTDEEVSRVIEVVRRYQG